MGGVLLVLTNILALRIPREIGTAIQYLRDTQSHTQLLDTSVILRTTLTIILLALGAAITRVLSRIFIFNAGRLIEYTLRNQLFQHLSYQSLAYFQRMATGDIVSRIANDVNYIRLMFGMGILNMVNTLVAYILVLFLMFGLSWKLTIYCLLPYPLIFLTMRTITRALFERTKASQAQLGHISARAQENLSGAAIVKAFGIQEEEIQTFQATNQIYLERNLALARVRGILMPYMMLVSGLGTLLVLWLGGSLVIDGSITLGEFVEFSGYIVILSWPTVAMGWVLSSWHRGMAAFERLMEIQQNIPEIVNVPPEDQGTLSFTQGAGIVFERVSLTYEDGTTALKDIDLQIAAGNKVAIVGRTGSGKSSLLHLIPRLRDPSSGEIRLNGMPLSKVKLEHLRQSIGYSPQDPFLFSTTIQENITFGLKPRTHQSHLSLETAIELACLTSDLATFPQGLETMVGERGITLSGGQKQRVALARALILKPEILLLDDALSSVDTHTERQILDGLFQLMEGRTSILTTHRYNMLPLMDQIIVLDQGQIVEQGTHDQLLAHKGLYSEIYERQKLAEELEEL